jgi:hypothetical protein
MVVGWFFNLPWVFPRKTMESLGTIILLGFGCLWIIAMMYGPLKNLRIKIYATLIIFTILAAVLTMWIIGNLFRGWAPS